MSKKILVVNLGWEQQPLIDNLINRGYQLYGITNDNNQTRNGFLEIFQCDYRDLESIFKFASLIKPDAVISDQCDYSHYVQAYLCERLKLIGPSLWQAQVSSNKFIQRKLAAEKGIRIPLFELVSNLMEAHAAISKIGLPTIIKPIDNRGSFGVSKINNKNELENAYYNALANSHSRFVLIEQYIEGYEITVDGYCFNSQPKSLSLAIKSKEGLSAQVSMDIKYPADIPENIYQKALLNNEFVTQNLGYTFGMTHSEYLIDKNNDIYLVESANRGGGVFTSEIIVPTVSAVNVLDRYIDDCLAITSQVTIPFKIEKNQVILKFFAFKTGKLKTITGIEDVQKKEGVLAFRLNVKPGDSITSIENDGSRHGFIIYHTNGNLREEVESVISQIKVEFEYE